MKVLPRGVLDGLIHGRKSVAAEAHLGSGKLLRASSLREVVGESKARRQKFLLLLLLFVYLKIHKLLVRSLFSLFLLFSFISFC